MKKHHENYSIHFLKAFVPSFVVACILVWLLVFNCGCGSPKVGCTTRQERKASKLLNKSYSLCPTPFVDLAAKTFNNVTYVHDTTTEFRQVPVFDTTYIGDTVLVVKTDTKVINHTITKQIENKAKIEQLEGELQRMNATNIALNSDIIITNQTLEKKENLLKIWKYRFFGLVLFNIIGVLLWAWYNKAKSII